MVNNSIESLREDNAMLNDYEIKALMVFIVYSKTTYQT